MKPFLIIFFIFPLLAHALPEDIRIEETTKPQDSSKVSETRTDYYRGDVLILRKSEFTGNGKNTTVYYAFPPKEIGIAVIASIFFHDDGVVYKNCRPIPHKADAIWIDRNGDGKDDLLHIYTTFYKDNVLYTSLYEAFAIDLNRKTLSPLSIEEISHSSDSMHYLAKPRHKIEPNQ